VHLCDLAFSVESRHGILVDRLMYDLLNLCCVLDNLLTIRDLIRV